MDSKKLKICTIYPTLKLLMTWGILSTSLPAQMKQSYIGKRMHGYGETGSLFLASTSSVSMESCSISISGSTHQHQVMYFLKSELMIFMRFRWTWGLGMSYLLTLFRLWLSRRDLPQREWDTYKDTYQPSGVNSLLIQKLKKKTENKSFNCKLWKKKLL